MNLQVWFRVQGFQVLLSLQDSARLVFDVSLEAQLPIYWVPVLGSLYKHILSRTQEPTVWVPGLLGYVVSVGLDIERMYL